MASEVGKVSRGHSLRSQVSKYFKNNSLSTDTGRLHKMRVGINHQIWQVKVIGGLIRADDGVVGKKHDCVNS